MKDCNVLGIDIAKNHFQLHGISQAGKRVFKRATTRQKFLETVVNLPGKFIVAMEACGGANHWGRELMKLGYEVKLISPQYVKAFLVGSKNDANDARAIALAAQQPSLPQVAVKTQEQQTLLTLCRIRASAIAERTAMGNRLRGYLLEYGKVFPQGLANLRRELPVLFAQANNGLPVRLCELLSDLFAILKQLDVRIASYDKDIKGIAANNEVCKRLMKIKGIGPIIAVVAYTTLGNASHFKNGRHCSAYLGLVPKEHSSGGTHRLLGISKRGNSYLRSLLNHGARSVLSRIGEKQDALSQWLRRLVDRAGFNKASIALANKLSRHIWAIMAYGEAYKAPRGLLKKST